MMLLGILCLVSTAVALPVTPGAPVIRDSDILSGIIMYDNDLHTNIPEIFKASAEEKDVKEDESKERAVNKVVLLPELPAAPELPPLDVNILRNLPRTEEKSQEFDEGVDAEADEYDDDEEDVKDEEPKDDRSKKEEFKEEERNKEEPEEEELKEDKSKEEEFKEEELNKEEPKEEELKKEEVKKEEPKEEKPKEEEPKKDDVKVTIEDIQEKPVSDSKKPIKWKIPRPSFLNNIFPFHFPSISSIWPFRGSSIRAYPRISVRYGSNIK